ncbi:MAG: hypothetical protein COA32_07750 [Fluviicola sp.]|nr:MAG: hypothetical protein COA32_07750 [Fluviicola sp.]
MKYLVLILLLPILLHTHSTLAQNNEEEEVDKAKVEQSVISWADTIFKEYNEPRFEKYRANYTDEYLMASLRAKGIEDRISELRKQYSSGKYTGTEKEFTAIMEDLKARRKEAEENMVGFHPKVTNYVINFWANILLDSGVLNYVNHKVILDDNYKVIKTKVVGNIGDNENAKIVYR